MAQTLSRAFENSIANNNADPLARAFKFFEFWFCFSSTITSGFGPAHIYNTNNNNSSNYGGGSYGGSNNNYLNLNGMNATMHKSKFLKSNARSGEARAPRRA